MYWLGDYMKIFKILKNYRNSEDINIKELNNLINENKEMILLDVRSPQEYREGHLKRFH